MNKHIVINESYLAPRYAALAVAWFVFGFVASAQPFSEPDVPKVRQIAGAVMHVADYMCKANMGIYHLILPTDRRNLHTFVCKDGAEFRDVTVNMK